MEIGPVKLCMYALFVFLGVVEVDLYSENVVYIVQSLNSIGMKRNKSFGSYW